MAYLLGIGAARRKRTARRKIIGSGIKPRFGKKLGVPFHVGLCGEQDTVYGCGYL
jgi:hypothetical protein